MKTVLICLLLALLTTQVIAQTTTGNHSPIIKGVNGKINYVRQQVVKQQIPDDLVPYLAGLLFTKKQIPQDKSSIDEALNVWFRKYKSLQAEIGKISDKNTKALALKHLNEGDFNKVEQLARIKTNYEALSNTFPHIYQTTGNNSPIIIGDYGTVTYVVKEIISYQLPEGVTLNLLEALRSKDKLIGNQNDKLNSMESTLGYREAVIKDFAARYGQVKAQLEKSPIQVFKRAAALFKKGDLDGAIKILDGTGTTDKAIGEARLLKARILLLKLSPAQLDEDLKEINLSYNIGVTLIRNSAAYFEYGKFLVDYYNNYAEGIPILEKADALSPRGPEKIQIHNYLGIAYSGTDRVKAEAYHSSALAAIDSLEIPDNRSLKILKVQLLNNLGASHLNRLYNRDEQLNGISYTLRAVSEATQLGSTTREDQYRLALIYNLLGRQYALLPDSTKAAESYSRSLNLMTGLYKQQPDQYAIGLTSIYYYLSELYFNSGNAKRGADSLEKAISLIQPLVSVKSKIFLITFEQLNTSLLKHYLATNRYSDIKKSLMAIRREIQPFILDDPKSFLLHQVWVDVDLGEFYFSAGDMASALNYLTPSLEYYLANLSVIQYDKPKAAKCFFIMNEALMRSGKIKEALRVNDQLLAKLKSALSINKLAFDDFLPQIKRQKARIFTYTEERDSAYHYINSAVADIEPKAKQFGLLYINSYSEYMSQAFLVYLYFNQLDEADRIAKKFIANCNAIIEIDEGVRQAQANVGELISSFSLQIMDVTRNPRPGRAITDHEKRYAMAASYFSAAEHFFQVAMKANPIDNMRYVLSLIGAINLHGFWMPLIDDANERQSHQMEKCRLAKLANEIISVHPLSEFVATKKREIALLSSDCR